MAPPPQEHQRVHLCESLYKCVKCFYSCNQIYDIYEHMHSIHKIQIEHIFKCPYDDMMFRDKETLFHHIGCHRIKDASARVDPNGTSEEKKEVDAIDEDPLKLVEGVSEVTAKKERVSIDDEEDDILPSTLLECNLDAVISQAKQVLQMTNSKDNQKEAQTEKTEKVECKNSDDKVPDCELEDEVLDEIDQSTLIDLDYVKNDMVINTENLNSNMNSENDSSIRMLAYFKNIKCAYCTKIFIMKNDLKNHLVVDHDLSKSVMNDVEVIKNEKFECTICKIKFDFAIDLSHHNTKEHTEFKCGTCNKVYHQSHNLKKHEKTCVPTPPKEKPVRPPKPLTITCEICDKTFKRNWNLKQHLQKVHKITHNP